MHFVLPLLACADPADPPRSDPPDDTIEPSPWVYDDDGDDEPPVDLDVLGRALDRAIVEVLSLSAEPVVGDYLALHAASAEPTCPPEVLDAYGNTYWQAYCTASDGTYWYGYLGTYNYADYYDPYNGVYLDGAELAGNIAVDRADGTYDLEGYAAYLAGESPDGMVRLVQSVLLGGFSHESPSATGWLREAGTGEAVTATLVGYSLPTYQGYAVIVDAALTVEVDGEPYAVVLDYLQLGNEMLGSLCADEPGGSVQIRDPHGRWFDATFSGPDLSYGTTLGDPAQCEGCAEAWLDGEKVGDLCASFDPWYQWEELR